MQRIAMRERPSAAGVSSTLSSTNWAVVGPFDIEAQVGAGGFDDLLPGHAVEPPFRTPCVEDSVPPVASNQTPLHRPDHHRRAIGHVEFAQDILHVLLDGFAAEVQAKSDFPVAQAIRQVDQDLAASKAMSLAAVSWLSRGRTLTG